MGYLGNTPGDKFLTLEKQVFTTSATDTYVLDREVSSANDLELFLNNVRQEPVEAYSCSGTTLTLASAITASDSMYCIYQGRAVGTQSPAVGSVTNDMLAGSIANAKLANSSITVNGTSISLGASGTISAGITEADQWRLTTNFTGNATPISSNLERVDTDGFGYIGTGMTQSSGVFTFPSTGIWLIRYTGRFRYNSYSRYCEGFIQTTTNNSTYDNASGFSTILARIEAGDMETSSSCEFIFDVTSTSTHKTRFTINLQNTGSTVQGDSNVNLTCFTFIRLGDT